MNFPACNFFDYFPCIKFTSAQLDAWQPFAKCFVCWLNLKDISFVRRKDKHSYLAVGCKWSYQQFCIQNAFFSVSKTSNRGEIDAHAPKRPRTPARSLVLFNVTWKHKRSPVVLWWFCESKIWKLLLNKYIKCITDFLFFSLKTHLCNIAFQTYEVIKQRKNWKKVSGPTWGSNTTTSRTLIGQLYQLS